MPQVKISHDELGRVRQALSNLSEGQQRSFNMRDVVLAHFDLIKEARAKRVDWEEITQEISGALGGDFQASKSTIQQYYYEFRRNGVGKTSPMDRSEQSKTFAVSEQASANEDDIASSSVVVPIKQAKAAQSDVEPKSRVERKSAAKKSRRFTKDVRPKRS